LDGAVGRNNGADPERLDRKELVGKQHAQYGFPAEDQMSTRFLGKVFYRLAAVLLSFGLACDGANGGTDVTDVPSSDLVDIATVDTTDVPLVDITGDSSMELPELPLIDIDYAEVLPSDAATCVDGAKWCSADGYVAIECKLGAPVETACMREKGQLCENGACVQPWAFGSPVFTTCDGVAGGTVETLAQKAAYYDEVATRLHIHPTLKWVMSGTLKKVEVECVGDAIPPCYAIPDEKTVTYNDVARWHTGENDGLWSAMYLTSQAFRYAVTRSDDALATIRLLLDGEVTRMKITGVTGLFTRQFIPPNVPGIACPDPEASKLAYKTDIEKDDNQWVQIRDDGCVWTVNRDTLEWEASTHCGLDEYKGWCWLDNVSQDEYAGHMLALGAIYKLVDQPDVQQKVKDLLAQVSDHLVRNELYFVDWDGRQTEHGKLHAYSFADTPGFLAAMSMDYILLGAVASGREDLRKYYNDCLLQVNGQCDGWPYPDEGPYQDFLNQMLLYVGEEGCGSNYNNFGMVFTSLHNLIWFETNPAIREIVQESFDKYFMREADQPRALIVQKNPWYDFGWAAFKRLGPGSDGPAIKAVDEGICSLKQFPASKVIKAKDSSSMYPHYCQQRLGGSATEFPVPVGDRCVETFEWWSDP
jgi:hypothetical protein